MMLPRASLGLLLSVVSLSALGAGDSGSTISVIPNPAATPATSELVTLGVPLAACVLDDARRFRLFDPQDRPVQLFAKPTMRWHFRARCPDAIRALKVQFRFDASAGPQTYRWDLVAPRAAADLTEQALTELTSTLPIKQGAREPRVLAVHPPDYLTRVGLLPPTSVASNNDYDQHYLPRKWESDSRDFDYRKQRASHWLFDRVSTNYRQAIRRGEIEHYLEAYRSYQWWSQQLKPPSPTSNRCDGGFTLGGKAGRRCDGKYIYAEPLKLHLALTGDDRLPPGLSPSASPGASLDVSLDWPQWWRAMADTVYLQATPRAGFARRYSKPGGFYTERSIGFALMTLLNLCELSADPRVCDRVGGVVDNIYQHHTANPDGGGLLGYQAHSWFAHEGVGQPYLGRVTATASGQLVLDQTLDDFEQMRAGVAIRVGSKPATVSAINATDQGTIELTIDGDGVPIGAVATADVSADPRALRYPTDRVFSPWMQSILADALWQYYWFTDDPQRRQQVAEMLLNFARAYAAYGVDGTRLAPRTRELLEQAFQVHIFDSQLEQKTDCGLQVAPFPRYVANHLMASPRMNQSYADFMLRRGSYADQHLPEGLFQLALGLYFETDAARRDAMAALARDTLEWFERYQCTSGNRARGKALKDPPRAWNWQNKADPFGTYCWVLEQLESEVELDCG